MWTLMNDGPRTEPGPGAQDLVNNETRLQRSEMFFAEEPRALPWAGMNDALGVGNHLHFHSDNAPVQ
jgi:hypothetical protein